tara:strand:- start:69 stop:377 length:309 start_codon:yes stop_codon:yes gene_type:complete
MTHDEWSREFYADGTVRKQEKQERQERIEAAEKRRIERLRKGIAWTPIVRSIFPYLTNYPWHSESQLSDTACVSFAQQRIIEDLAILLDDMLEEQCNVERGS